jgi:asparagine synthase (glutamine-hydrolysing)
VPVPAPSADDLASVVRTIEMPSKAQVEIGWPCLVLAEAMRADGFKVTYSGEGSDELWASYGFCYHALQRRDWHQYRKALFGSQARKNFPRANNVFMRCSVECRLPFLHTPLVELALSLPEHVVREGRSRPKAVLQDAVADLLPTGVVRRPKLAFQDGLGLKTAIAQTIASPERFYHAEHHRVFEREQPQEQPGTHACRP